MRVASGAAHALGRFLLIVTLVPIADAMRVTRGRCRLTDDITVAGLGLAVARDGS